MGGKARTQKVTLSVRKSKQFDEDRLLREIEKHFVRMVSMKGGRYAGDASRLCAHAMERAALSGQLDELVRICGGTRTLDLTWGDECLYEYLPEQHVVACVVRPVSTVKLQSLIACTDVLLVTATEREKEAVLTLLAPADGHDQVIEGSFEALSIRIGRFGNYQAAHVECSMGTSGPRSSTLTVADAIRVISPKATLIIGIAFGVNRSHQRLGDVLVAETIQPYEHAKVEANGEQTTRSPALPCHPILLDRFCNRCSGWILKRGASSVKVHAGGLLSGEKLVNEEGFRDALKMRFQPTPIGVRSGSPICAEHHPSQVDLRLG